MKTMANKFARSILVTGGAGYIGSHTCVELINSGYRVIVFDNLCNSHPEVLNRIELITKIRPEFVHGDVCDRGSLVNVLKQYDCSAVIHFAGLKAVADSVMDPLGYYENNVNGTIQLLLAMQEVGVKKLVFSSSATVYGAPLFLPYTEDHPLNPINPYGRSKMIVEDLLRDHYAANPDWSVCILRYFNPVGAHESGMIGENPKGVPSNLMPYIGQVAIGTREKLNIWGTDYSTIDGTGVRDYVHVVDLAFAHLAALEHLSEPQCLTLNIGTGVGNSVLDVVNAFESASGRKIPIINMPRREGDIGMSYADPSLAKELLNWSAKRDLTKMCQDYWTWQQRNPIGYG